MAEETPVQRTLAEQLTHLVENPNEGSITPFPGLRLKVDMHHVRDGIFHVEVQTPDGEPITVEHLTPPEVSFRFHVLQMLQMAVAEKAGPALADEVEAYLASQAS